jgi:hypothetical protein
VVVPEKLNGAAIRRCPMCASLNIHRALRRNLVERLMLRAILLRPFRCNDCSNRYYGLSFRRRAPMSLSQETDPDSPVPLPVLVYGRQKDHEPFREETDMLLVDVHGALLRLSTGVEPGQKLVVISPATEEDQRCRVAFVSEKQAGRSVIGVRFARPAWEFWSLAVHPTA